MRLIDADIVYRWYVNTFKGKIKTCDIRFSMNDIKNNLENIPTVPAVSIKDMEILRSVVQGHDIPSPTVPEYAEHHDQIQEILKLIDAIIANAKGEKNE